MSMQARHSPPVVIIIPARYASQRFPGKMLADVQGKTLIQRTYENARKMGVGEQIFIATEDPRIAQHARSFGAEVVLTAPTCANGTERIVEVLQQRPDLPEETLVVNIQGDEPCIPASTVQAVVSLMLEDPSLPMATAVTPLRREEANDPSVVKAVINRRKRALYFSRALIPSGDWGENKPYYKHLGIYAYRKPFLISYGACAPTPLQQAEDLEQLKALEEGHAIGTAVVAEDCIGVNTPEDLVKLEEFLCRQNTSSLQAELSQA